MVLEVVPGTLPGSSAEGVNNNPETTDEDVVAVAASKKDEDVLEIPVFVHMDWDADAQLDQQNIGRSKDEKVTRELAYWMVLGVGRIQASL